MLIFIIDIDGTVCNSIPRVKEICDSLGVNNEDDLDKVWTDEAMNLFLKKENIMKDGIIQGAENIMEIVNRCNGLPIFLTGRNEYGRDSTRKWLSEVLHVPKYVKLIMRPNNMKNGYTADCKEELFLKHVYRNFNNGSFIFLEDHKETAKRYSKYGLVLLSPECWKTIL
jgi:hypothetical protein